MIIIGAGEDEDRSGLERLAAELGVAEDMSMPGFQTNPYSYMKASDVYVMSSRWEGPGNALIEAQALGTPCISTDCPDGPRDTLLDGEAGLLVPVGDHHAMAEAIGATLSEGESTARRVRAGLDSRHRFEVESVAAEWMAFLSRLATPNQPSATRT